MLAIQLMGDKATDRPTSFRSLGAKKLQCGITILVLLTEEAAAWLRQDRKRAKFMEFMDGSALCFQLQSFPVLGTFVPITFDSSTQSLQDIQQMAALNQGDIISAKWIKPPSQQASSQQTGHMILVLQSLEAANKLIKNWVYIKGKQVKITKFTSEPRRYCHDLPCNLFHPNFYSDTFQYGACLFMSYYSLEPSPRLLTDTSHNRERLFPDLLISSHPRSILTSAD